MYIYIYIYISAYIIVFDLNYHAYGEHIEPDNLEFGLIWYCYKLRGGIGKCYSSKLTAGTSHGKIAYLSCFLRFRQFRFDKTLEAEAVLEKEKKRLRDDEIL